MLHLAVILAALLPATSGLAQMGPPPDPFLECYEFLDTNWVSDFGYLPLNCTNLTSVSVEEENALMLDTTNLEPAFLQYNVVETDGHTNLDFGAGAVSALVISDWASADTNQNGEGPGELGYLLAAGDWSSNAPDGFWAIYVDAGGTNIYFGGVSNSVAATYVSAPISWASNSIHMIGLTYTTNSVFYLDGQLAATGGPVTIVPSTNTWTNGLYIGSDASGYEQFRGIFLYMELDNSAIDSSNIISDWGPEWFTYGWSETTNYYDTWLNPSGAGQNSMLSSGVLTWHGSAASPDFSTNNGVYLTNMSVSNVQGQGKTFTFTIKGGTDGVSYNMFTTSKLAGPRLTNSVWTWLGQGTNLGTYQVTNQPGLQSYYVLGPSLLASNANGVTYPVFANGYPGILINLHTNSQGGLQINDLTNTTPLPFVTVANSYQPDTNNGIRVGTVARILFGANPATNPSRVIGEYYSAPLDQGGDPSRTTVDRYGNVWVGNRAADGSTQLEQNYFADTNGNGMGSVTEFGVVIGGTRGDKVAYNGTTNYLGLTNWSFVTNASGHYLQPPFIYNTCVDRDGDGLIHTSTGLGQAGMGDLLQWGANDTLVNCLSNALDEAIIHYVRTMPTGVRSIPIDASNGFWAGSDGGDYQGNGWQEYIDTTTGMPVTGRRIYFGPGGYGGVVGGDGTVWSIGRNSDDSLGYTAGLLRFVPKAGIPPVIIGGVISGNTHDNVTPNEFYGIGIDPRTDNPWLSGFDTSDVARFSTNGSWEAIQTPLAGSQKGILVDANGNVWIASGDGEWNGNYGVYHLLTSGDFVGFISTSGTNNNGIGNVYENGTNASSICGEEPYGISMDSQGMIWTICRGEDTQAGGAAVPTGYGYYAMRIDPTQGPTTNIFGTNYAVGQVVEAVDLGYDAQPYDYSDMTGYVTLSTTQPAGVWDFVQDSGAANMLWSSVTESANVPSGSSIVTEVRAADRITDLPSWPFRTVSGTNMPAIKGRYMEVRVNLLRNFGVSQGPTLNSLTVNWGGAGSAMQITNQPQNAMVQPGSTVIFSVGLSGATNVSYQWRTNDVTAPNHGNISGATTATLTVSNAQYTNAGLYSVTVTDTNGTVLNSAEARLHILGNAPAGVSYYETSWNGNIVELTWHASPAISNAVSGKMDTGIAPFYYQWLFGQTPIPGAFGQCAYSQSSSDWTATLNVTNTQCTNDGNYSVIFWNQYGEFLSPDILPDPGSSYIKIGPATNVITNTTQTVTLTASNYCFGLVAAQWFITGPDGVRRPIPGATNFTSGATNFTYTLPTPITCASMGTYALDVFDPSWTPHEATALVTNGVNATVLIQSMTMTLNPIGGTNGTWSYSNQESTDDGVTWENYGYQGPTLTMIMNGNQDGYYFRILATQTNIHGTITNTASVTVFLDYSGSDGPYLSLSNIQNGAANLALTPQSPTGPGPWTNWSWTYSYYGNVTNVPTSDNGQLTITNITCDDSGSYTVQVSNPCGDQAAEVMNQIHCQNQ